MKKDNDSLNELTTVKGTQKGVGIYKAQSDALKAKAMAADINGKISLLQESDNRGRVDLNDRQRVKEITFAYMEQCGKAGVFPTVLGLATSLGISRRWLNMYMQIHPQSPTTEFLEVVKDAFADIMSNAALFRNADTATTIFILKNCAGFVDKVEIEAAPAHRDELVSQEELEKRIVDLVCDDDND